MSALASISSALTLGADVLNGAAEGRLVTQARLEPRYDQFFKVASSFGTIPLGDWSALI